MQARYTFIFIMLLVYIFTFVGETVYFKFETDDEAEELSFNDDETVKDKIHASNVREFIISHKGKPLSADMFLAHIYMQTSRENPINVRRCLVWVSIDDSLPKQMPYRCLDMLRSLYDEKLYLVVFNNSVQKGICYVREFLTTKDNPLYVKTISKYVKWPERVLIDISGCDTVEDLFKKGNVRKDDYMVFVEGKKCEPRNVRLRVAIRNGREVEIMKNNEGIHDFALPLSIVIVIEKLMEQMNEYGLYTNWFAMSLYDCMEFERGPFELAKQVQQILEFVPGTAKLRFGKDELTYTSLLFVAFDHFMRKDGHCCLHQCAIYNGSLPDFYMASLNNELPQHPKLIADFKIDEFEQAEAKSFHYCMAMVDQTDANYPILTMPCTSKKFKMYLCIPESHSQMAYIKIMEAQVDDTEKLALFFCKMRLGVKTLQPDMFGNKPFAIMPKRDLTFGDKENLSQQRVFKHYDRDNIRVYKLYDDKMFGSPNVEIMKNLGDNYLGKVELEKIAKDGRIKLLSYDYQWVKKDSAVMLECYQPIIKALDMLHSKAIVHSDVRLRNMLFLNNGDAKLIDFDLADKVDTTYPTNYNSNVEYRHEDAKPGERRKIDHDRYSLLCILGEEFKLTPKQKRKIDILNEKIYLWHHFLTMNKGIFKCSCRLFYDLFARYNILAVSM